MKKRTVVALALAVVFVLAFAAPALAQSISYQAGYNVDGTVNQKMQAGHLCNTGAELKQTITGTGALTKGTSITMVQNRITVGDTNDWVTAVDAVRNMTVTSVIELCTPPKYTVYDAATGFTGVLPLPMLYPPVSFGGPEYIPPFWSFSEAGDLVYDGNTLDDVLEALEDTYGLTATPVNERQIWAVQVAADPGFSGNVHQGFEAAYGPFYGGPGLAQGLDGLFGPDDDMPAGLERFWAWQLDEDDNLGVLYGDAYVGDYFSISQMSRTSKGVHKRYIDISSPWSHGYLYEDMSVTGLSEVTESFTLGNLASGIGVAGLWWDLF